MYKVLVLWQCDKYEKSCTDEEIFEIKDLNSFLILLPSLIESIESYGSIIYIEINKL